MPHFDSEGNDTYLCQLCGNVRSVTTRDTLPQWRPDLTGHEGAGNVCPTCIKQRETAQTSNVTWIDARFNTECPTKCGAQIRRGDKIGKPDGTKHFVCARCVGVLQADKSLARVIREDQTLARRDAVRTHRAGRNRTFAQLAQSEPLNRLDYADNPAEYELQLELERRGIRNAPRPDQCREHLCELEEVPGVVGETMLRCLQGGEIVWEDAEQAIRIVF